jgi:hypothetical protein
VLSLLSLLPLLFLFFFRLENGGKNDYRRFYSVEVDENRPVSRPNAHRRYQPSLSQRADDSEDEELQQHSSSAKCRCSLNIIILLFYHSIQTTLGAWKSCVPRMCRNIYPSVSANIHRPPFTARPCSNTSIMTVTSHQADGATLRKQLAQSSSSLSNAVVTSSHFRRDHQSPS